MDEKDHHRVKDKDKILSALFYAFVSLAVIFCNKAVMTKYNFGHFEFIACVQFVATSFILSLLIYFKKIDVPTFTMPICKEIFPITAMFLGNVVCGLGSTKSLNLPMFTALRRFSIFMTMCAEFIVIGNKPSPSVLISVMMMVGGAMIAAIYDLTFDFQGYLLVFLNNTFTALNGVWMKKASISGKCNKMGILYYNSLFSAIIMILYFTIDYYSVNSVNDILGNGTIKGVRGSIQNIDSSKSRKLLEDIVTAHVVESIPEAIQETSKLVAIWNYPGWSQPDFCFLFICSAFLGTLLNYAIFLCTTINSALTTAVIGCLKNVATTYISMLILPDYIFNHLNFIGLNISIIGSIYYTYITIFKGATGFGS